ncbi:MAG: hypothetical protein PUP46_09395 [Endozoicomonas sp. (ex Botrylloides leachii)]|nr:hypothetical protein [Endozoicomonas sp. (ex Botrylloides leachii)]
MTYPKVGQNQGPLSPHTTDNSKNNNKTSSGSFNGRKAIPHTSKPLLKNSPNSRKSSTRTPITQRRCHQEKSVAKTIRNLDKPNFNPVKDKMEKFADNKIQAVINAARTIDALAKITPAKEVERLKNMGLSSKGIQETLQKIKNNKPVTMDEKKVLVAALYKNKSAVIAILNDIKAETSISSELTKLLEKGYNGETCLESLLSECQKAFQFKEDSSLLPRINDLEVQVDNLNDKTEEVNKNLTKKADKTQVADLESRLENFINTAPENNLNPEEKKMIEGLHEKTKQFNDFLITNKEEKDSYEKRISHLEHQLEVIKSNNKNTILDSNTDSVETLSEYQKKYDELEKHINMLKNKIETPTSSHNGSLSTNDYDQHIKNIEIQLKEATIKADSADNKADEAITKADQAQKDIDDIKPEIDKLKNEAIQNHKLLLNTKEEIESYKKSLADGKAEQEKLIARLREEINKKEFNNRKSDEEVHTSEQSSPQTSPDDNSTNINHEKYFSDLASQIKSLEERASLMLDERNKLSLQNKNLDGRAHNIEKDLGNKRFFIEAKKTINKLKDDSKKLSENIDDHSNQVNQASDEAEQLKDHIFDQGKKFTDAYDENDLFEDNNTESTESTESTEKLENTPSYDQANTTFEPELEEAKTLIEKDESLRLLKDAQAALTALINKDLSVDQPLIEAIIDGKMQHIVPPSDWLKEQPDDRYQKIIKKIMSATKSKKTNIKKSIGNNSIFTMGTSTADVHKNIANQLEKIKARIKKEELNNWNKEIDNLKTHLRNTFILEIDSSYWIKRTKKKSDS